MSRAVARAWRDRAYAGELRQDPASALKAAGVDLPQLASVRLEDAEPGEIVLLIPPRSSSGLDEDRLRAIAAGDGSVASEADALGRAIAKAWLEPDFAQSLHRNPAMALETAGVDAPKGARIRVVDVAPGEIVLVVPARTIEALDDDQLEAVSGGDGSPFGVFDPGGGGGGDMAPIFGFGMGVPVGGGGGMWAAVGGGSSGGGIGGGAAVIFGGMGAPIGGG